MKRPAISRFERQAARGWPNDCGERGVTILLVAAALVTIMAMAALSIDVVTLYLANAEAQRSADAAALAGARILSLSGMTGDPQNSTSNWAAACTTATQVAQAVANQNIVGGATPNSVNVTFPNDPSGNCSDANVSTIFGVNPVVQVQVQRTNLPTFFARIWGRKGGNVSGTAVAEAYNSSASGVVPGGSGSIVSVQPRCVKPWIISNVEPQTAKTFVGPADGSITNPGIQLNYVGTGGVIGEQFTLKSACGAANCKNMKNQTLATSNYIPALIQDLPAPLAVPSCATSDNYQEAIGGCDQSTVYACGQVGGANANLNVSLGGILGDTSAATQCLINNAGADSLNNAVFPFQIRAGSANPLLGVGLAGGDVITASNSIVAIPIMDGSLVGNANQPPVTIVGFLQAFIQNVDINGNPVVTILNVSGCSNTSPASSVTGSSPVPVRLINYP